MPATKVHFNGSVNLADTETVMREIASRVPAGVSRIPDGETGDRSNWFSFQLKKFAATPGIASSAHPDVPGFPRFRVSGEVPARELAWPDPGYADIYGASYQVFTRLRAEGAVPGGVRFQAQFPTPMVFISAFAPGEDYDALLARSERAMFADLDHLLARIPHDDLAVQWDVAGEVIQLASAPGAPVDKDRIPGLLARCLDRVPADVPAGLHLCYGDAGHQHTIEPQSLELQVILINSVVAAAHRALSWVSFTVPQDRSDPGFFAPLRSLRTGAAERYFGIVPYHPARQGAGTIQRQAQLIETYLPRDVSSEWGISTECGIGRVGQAADVLALLDAHRDILASLEQVRAHRRGLTMADPVPVLVITGPVGVGKSTVANEAAWLLRQADVPHALVDLDRIEQCWPVPADDPWNERVSHRNLACMWANFRQAGADRLILVRVLEARSLLRRVAQAVPGAQITVVRLRAPLSVLHERIRSREASDPRWFLGAATHTAEVFERAQVEDHLVDNQDRPVTEVAEEVLHRVGWLPYGTVNG